MKSWIKKWFIAAGIMIAAGIIICAGIFTASGFKISVFNTAKERVKKEENIQKNYIVNLYLETSNSEVVLKKTTSKDFISVTYYESEDITFDFIDTSHDDGTLKIIENDNSKWYNNMVMFDFQNTPLIVEIPEDEWGKITISTSSGNILIDQINCQELNADTSSGEINASNISSQKEALFDTSSGDIYISSISTDCLSVDTSSGETYVSDINNLSDMNIDSSSGDITIKNSAITKQIVINTSSGETEISDVSADNMVISSNSGDVELSRTDAMDYKIDTSSGEVFGTIKGDDNTVSFITDTSSGDVSVPSPSKGEKTFSASTSSGDIEIAFEK